MNGAVRKTSQYPDQQNRRQSQRARQRKIKRCRQPGHSNETGKDQNKGRENDGYRQRSESAEQPSGREPAHQRKTDIATPQDSEQRETYNQQNVLRPRSPLLRSLEQFAHRRAKRHHASALRKK